MLNIAQAVGATSSPLAQPKAATSSQQQLNNIKTMNQMYKQSGSTLSFKEWIQQQKEDQQNTMPSPVKDSAAPQANVAESQTFAQKVFTKKNILIGTGVAVVLAGAFLVYKKMSK